MKKLPKKMDTRVDYIEICSTRYSALVESVTNDVIYLESGYKTVNEMYKALKFILNNDLTIDNYPFSSIKYFQIEGANYDFEFKKS